MKHIKNYFKRWDPSRVFRLILAAILFIVWFFAKEPLIAAFGTILLVQAVFNISCCPGGSCTTGTTTSTKTDYKIEKYQQN